MISVLSIAINVIDAIFGIIGLLMIVRLLLQVFKVQPNNALLKFLRTVTDPILNLTNKWLGIPTYRYSLPTVQSEMLSIIAALIVVWAGRTVLVWILTLVGSIPIWALDPIGNLYNILTTLLSLVFELYMLAIFVRILFGWLRVSAYSKVMSFLHKITEPVLSPIRKIVPSFSGLDISPVLAYFLLQFLRTIVFSFLAWIFL